MTQRLFGGKSWASSPELAQEMFRAYYKYRLLHELMAVLELAMQKVSVPHARPLQEAFLLIDNVCESGLALSDAVQLNVLKTEVFGRVRQAYIEENPLSTRVVHRR